ncbi:uncharacterized protein LOC123004108 [Tribolium madens]|uniref:uncharacterized protein LOC123004108 n=1 Tax=Tribolium madens TaxID=41895 RepID=UPI001CF76253|nr:uncharacterized protein LOC123004108 [Tribolium madens]
MKSTLVLFFYFYLSAAEETAIQEFTNANNQFTSSVYKQLSKSEKGNFLLSPFSAETVLAFAQSGCKGDSAEELRNGLHLPDKTKVESALKSLLPKVKGNDLYTLHTANKMYVKNNFPLKEEFKKAATEVFQADSENIDFLKNTEAAKTMNGWVEEHTNSKIKNLINSDDLNQNTRAVLINALYFKANWSLQFPLPETYKNKFYKTTSDSIEVDMMHHYEEHFNYYECPHLKAKFLELPFQGGEASMIFVLPNEKDGLESLENQLESVFVPQHHLERTLVNVVLPKFRIESLINFVEILKKLGVKKVFDEKEADLSGIAGEKGDLVIDKIAQKTYIDLGEGGVEAAAATYVITAFPSSALLEQPKPKIFIADHPFIFYIKVKDLILFAGRVTNPFCYWLDSGPPQAGVQGVRLTTMKSTLVLFFYFYLSAAEETAIQEFTNANNQFTSSVYKQLSKSENGNFLLSPFSAETVLAFAQSGCKGDSAEELRNGLHLPDKTKVESALKSLLPKVKGNDLYTLHTANKMYVKNDFPLKEEFKKAATEVFQADSENIDFLKNTEAAKTMNGWVEEHTNSKIKNLINPSFLDNRTRVVLINALFFKANWSLPFQLSLTRKDKFYKTASGSIEVDMMHHFQEHFNYYECPHLKAQFLELPFKGNEASMVFVLPNEKDGLARLENQLESVFVPQHQLEKTFLNVVIPKFRIKSEIDFKSILEKLGVTKVFLEDKADLSGIAGKKGDLVINKVVQKDFIDVSEEGVEAAAATYVLISVPFSAPIAQPKNFIADHPFIFYIKIKDLIVFAGRVNEPKV